MTINTYYLKARLFPTILTSVPAVLGYNLYIAKTFNDRLAGVYNALPEITNAALSGAIIFLLVQVNRFLAKEVVQTLYFEDELKMPSTNFLLKADPTLETSIKKKIEDKMKSNFNIKLLSAEEEAKDEYRARKLIVTAVSQLRNSMRSNSLLFQHNIEYGFFRNLIGGSILAAIVGIAICITAHVQSDYATERAAYIAIAIYSTPLIFSKFILARYGRDYAKILYEQFLAKPPEQK